MNVTDPATLPRKDRNTLRKAILQAEREGVPKDVPAISAEPGLQALWQTIRGIHAAIYREFLPNDTSNVTLAPVPTFSSRSKRPIDEQLRRGDWFTERILAAVEGAIRAEEWDGVTAWGGEIRYRCVWHITEVRRAPKSFCFWVLDTPQSLAWSEVVVGRPVPWRGIYRRDAAPPDATMLSDRAIQLVGDAHDREAHRNSIRALRRLAGRAR